MGAVFEGIVSFYMNNPKNLINTIFLIILCILIKIYYPKLRGFMGEFWVKEELRKLPKNKYKVLNNIMISDNRGTHQIDHIVISQFGIFVIEMKNYYGLIKGNDYDNKWCQYLGKKKSYFFNPNHQNYGHIKSLLNIIDLDEDSFISVVCFSNQAKVNVKSRYLITQTDMLCKDILKHDKVIIKCDLKEIEDIILANNITDKKLRKEHIRKIKDNIVLNKSLEDNMICPKCKSKLIERNGKYGKFIGCSNYPKCKYTKKI